MQPALRPRDAAALGGTRQGAVGGGSEAQALELTRQHEPHQAFVDKPRHGDNSVTQIAARV